MEEQARSLPRSAYSFVFKTALALVERDLVPGQDPVHASRSDLLHTLNKGCKQSRSTSRRGLNKGFADFVVRVAIRGLLAGRLAKVNISRLLSFNGLVNPNCWLAVK